MGAAISIFLANLPALIKAGQTIGNYIHDFRAAAQQSGEWTDEHEADYQAKVEAAAKSRRWQKHRK